MKRTLLFLFLATRLFGQNPPPAAFDNYPVSISAQGVLVYNATTARLEVATLSGLTLTGTGPLTLTGGGGGGAGIASDTFWAAKGDLAVGTLNDTAQVLSSSGINNQVLTVDTSTATGLKWAAPSGGSFTAPTGTGFMHVTSSLMDSASVGETGTGNVVRTASPSFLPTANNTNIIFGRRQTNTAPTGNFLLFDNTGDTKAIFRTDVTGQTIVQLDADALNGLTINRFTDTTPTGNFLDFKNSTGATSLWTTDITGTLTAGTVPEVRLSFTDVTTNNASTTAHGFLPKLNNSSTQFLNGQGGWSTPAGGGTVTNDNNLTANSVVLGGAGGITATKVATGIITSGTNNAKLTLGVASTTAGSIDFKNATGAGTITVQSAAGGAGATTLTLPATTGTVALTGTTLANYGITDAQPLDSDLTTWAGITPGSGVGTFLATPSSANLFTAMTTKTGSGGSLVFATGPTLSAPVLGTPASGNLSGCTGYLTSALSGNVAVSQLPANANLRTISFTVDGGGSAISTGKVKGFFTCPYSGTITAWNITIDTGSATIDVWKKATGPAKPTSSDKVTSTAGLILTGGNTSIRSTDVTTTNFVSGGTTVTANDIFAFNLQAVTSATEISCTLEITIN